MWLLWSVLLPWVCAVPKILHVIQTSTYQLWRNASCGGSFLRAAAWICIQIWHTLSRFGWTISFETHFCRGHGNTGFTPQTCGGKNLEHVLKSDSLYKCDLHALFSLPGCSHFGHVDDKFACLFLRWMIPTSSLRELTLEPHLVVMSRVSSLFQMSQFWVPFYTIEAGWRNNATAELWRLPEKSFLKINTKMLLT